MKRARRILGILNGLLSVAILVFGARLLAFPPRVNYLEGIDPDAALPSPPPRPSDQPNEAVLLTLRNPLQPHQDPLPPPPPAMALQGALPTVDGQQGVAFVRTARNTSLVVPIGQEVQGWRLEELWRDQAAFTNSRGERSFLQIGR